MQKLLLEAWWVPSHNDLVYCRKRFRLTATNVLLDINFKKCMNNPPHTLDVAGLDFVNTLEF